jgi:hypothetical protein
LRVQVTEQIQEGHHDQRPQEGRVSGAGVLAAEQGCCAHEDAEPVEHEVEPGSEHGAGAVEPGDLAVHAVHDEAQVEQRGAGDQPPAVLGQEAGRRCRAQQHRQDGQQVRGDPPVGGDQADQPCREWIYEQDGPPRVADLIGLLADVLQ